MAWMADTAERRYGSFDSPPQAAEPSYQPHSPGETSRDLGARMRDLGMASRGSDPGAGFPAPPGTPGAGNRRDAYPPHPFAATPPPPVPPQSSSPEQTHRIRAEQHRAPAEPAANERLAPPRSNAMPTPLPKPIPLQVERPEETEIAARRLAALLRDDPSLLNNAPRD